MAQFGSVAYALAQYDMTPHSPRQCWSARNDHEVAGAFMVTQLQGTVGSRTHTGYDLGDSRGLVNDTLAFREWRENLAWAWNRNRRIRLIEATGRPNRRSFVAKPEYVMRLVSFSLRGAFKTIEEPF
jgi:hypothetical protein